MSFRFYPVNERVTRHELHRYRYFVFFHISFILADSILNIKV